MDKPIVYKELQFDTHSFFLKENDYNYIKSSRDEELKKNFHVEEIDFIGVRFIDVAFVDVRKCLQLLIDNNITTDKLSFTRLQRSKDFMAPLIEYIKMNGDKLKLLNIAGLNIDLDNFHLLIDECLEDLVNVDTMYVSGIMDDYTCKEPLSANNWYEDVCKIAKHTACQSFTMSGITNASVNSELDAMFKVNILKREIFIRSKAKSAAKIT